MGVYSTKVSHTADRVDPALKSTTTRNTQIKYSCDRHTALQRQRLMTFDVCWNHTSDYPARCKEDIVQIDHLHDWFVTFCSSTAVCFCFSLSQAIHSTDNGYRGNRHDGVKFLHLFLKVLYVVSLICMEEQIEYSGSGGYFTF